MKRRTAWWFADVYDPVAMGASDGADAVPHDRALIRAAQSKCTPIDLSATSRWCLLSAAVMCACSPSLSSALSQFVQTRTPRLSVMRVARCLLDDCGTCQGAMSPPSLCVVVVWKWSS